MNQIQLQLNIPVNNYFVCIVWRGGSPCIPQAGWYWWLEDEPDGIRTGEIHGPFDGIHEAKRNAIKTLAT